MSISDKVLQFIEPLLLVTRLADPIVFDSPICSHLQERASTPAVTNFFEAWSVLAFVAARTRCIKLSTMVSGITMRNPAVLVKTADTLDALSHGRAYLGVGASPDFGADEHQRMGLPFPPAGERVACLEEVLQMALQLWSGEDKPFKGTYYQLASTIGTQLFVQQPHPPILIAGSGNKMLRLMASYADAISIGFGRGLDDLRAKLEVLHFLRPPSAVRFAIIPSLGGTCPLASPSP